MSTVAPGAVVPVTVTVGVVTVRPVGRRGDRHRQRPRRPGPDVPVADDRGLLQRPAGAEREDQPGLLGLRPGQRRGRAGRLAVDEADRRGRRVGAERRRGQVRVLPGLLRHHPDARGGVVHRRRAARSRRPGRRSAAAARPARRTAPASSARSRVAGRPRLAVRASSSSGRRRSSRRTRPRCPASTCRTGRSRCRWSVSRPDRLVDDRQRGEHVRVVRRQLAEPGQLLEAGVDDRALVGGRAAVAEVVGDRRVRVAGLGQPDEVAPGRVRAGGGDRPALDRALEEVGGGPVDPGGGGVAVDVGDPAGRDQPGDLGRDRGRREAALLLPPLGAERRAVRDDEVGGLLDVVAVERAVPGQAGLPGHQDRVRRLVQLVAAGVRRLLAVGQRVARHPAVGQLLALEQEPGRRLRGRGVAGDQQPGERLVQVAGEDLAVGPEVVGLAVGQVAGADRLAPRAAEPGRDRARERLVLAGLHHVDGQVVLLGQPQGLRGGQAGQPQRRALQPRVVARSSRPRTGPGCCRTTCRAEAPAVPIAAAAVCP